MDSMSKSKNKAFTEKTVGKVGHFCLWAGVPVMSNDTNEEIP